MGTYGLRSVHPDFSTPPGFQFLQNGDDHYGRGVVVGYRDKVAARLIPGAAAATHRMPPKRRLIRRGTVVEDVPATATPARPASRPRTPGSAPVEAVDSPDGADTATDFGAAGAVRASSRTQRVSYIVALCPPCRGQGGAVRPEYIPNPPPLPPPPPPPPPLSMTTQTPADQRQTWRSSSAC